MKYLVFLFMLIPSVVFSQNPFKGIFKPLDHSFFKVDQTTDMDKSSDLSSSLWVVRPKIMIEATQFTFENPPTVSSFSSIGIGFSYQYITSQNGQPFTTFGANALIFLTDGLGDTEIAKTSLGGTITILNYLDFGGGYSFYRKKPFLLFGVSYHFN